MSLDLYPWQESDYLNLLALKRRLPHAVILHGSAAIGASVLAMAWIKSLLCLTPQESGVSCGVCQSCVLFDNDNHPDFFAVEKNFLPDQKVITVADIRNITDFLSLSTHIASYKVVYIEHVELLHLNSANALLKILEEPPSYVVFVLLAANLTSLLPTVLSRCFKYKLTLPTREISQAFLLNRGDSLHNHEFWLNYYDNAPLFSEIISDDLLEKIIQILLSPKIEEIFITSEELVKQNVSFDFMLKLLIKWMSDIISLKISGLVKYFIDYQNQLTMIVKKLDLEHAFYFVDRLSFLTSWSKHPLNYKLQLENLLFQYQQLFKTR